MNSKNDFTKLLFNILNPLRDLYTPKKTGIIHHGCAAWYDDAAARCESFSRPLWGLVPYFCGGGRDEEFEKIYIEGITNGTNPDCDEYFGDCRDKDQRFVEMAAFAYGLLFCPKILWEPLADNAKASLCGWLYQINIHEVCDSNWIFFRILVNSALKKLGRKYSSERLKSDLKRIDEFYISDGWYRDGEKGQKDYYISFAFHFYGLIYAKAMSEDKEYSEKFKKRACEFAKTFIYWFADNGEALPYGRSLTYRFAQIAFWSACVFTKTYPFPPGVIKGIIVRNLELWAQSDMFDYSHLLTVGYKYQNQIMAENYNAYGSPYWSLKAFAFLGLAEDDEFFKAEACDMPKLDDIKTISAADMVIARRGGNVTAYPAGTHNEFGCGQIIPKYLKFAYSTVFGFSVPKSNISLEEFAPDSSLCFKVNNIMIGRGFSYGFEIKDNSVTIQWSAFENIKVKTVIIPSADGHKRIHTINSPFECMAYDCAFAVAARDKDECLTTAFKNGARAENNFSFCEITSKSGGEGIIINASPNTNLMYNKSVIPAVRFKINKGETIIETEIKE